MSKNKRNQRSPNRKNMPPQNMYDYPNQSFIGHNSYNQPYYNVNPMQYYNSYPPYFSTHPINYCNHLQQNNCCNHTQQNQDNLSNQTKQVNYVRLNSNSPQLVSMKTHMNPPIIDLNSEVDKHQVNYVRLNSNSPQLVSIKPQMNPPILDLNSEVDKHQVNYIRLNPNSIKSQINPPKLDLDSNNMDTNTTFASSSSLESKDKDQELHKKPNIKTMRFALAPADAGNFLNFLNTMEKKENKENTINDEFINILKLLDGKCCEPNLPSNNLTKEGSNDNTTNVNYNFNESINYENLEESFSNLQDLIDLGKKYKPELKNKYAFDYEKLYNIIEPLEELNNVIGMDKVKKSIISQISYFLLGLEPLKDMLHTVIQGPPGVGKTMLGHIIAKIYHKMGIIECSNNNFKFKVYKRSDLVGQYLGQTAIKTQNAIDECIGGVMFIDEAYSLGSVSNSSNEKNDTYSKECIDCINQNLSERAGKFVCIIAGYADQLDKHFFSVNEGLKRRFTFKYTIDKYEHNELAKIFCKKIYDNSWNISKELYDTNISQVLIEFMKTNYTEFPNFAGDIETFILHVKLAHGFRIFGKNPDSTYNRKLITIDDINIGLQYFIKARNENKEAVNKHSLYAMYS